MSEEMFYPSEEMEVSKHFVHKCQCGEIIAQCRCPSEDKIVTVLKIKCDGCRDKGNVKLETLALAEMMRSVM